MPTRWPRPARQQPPRSPLRRLPRQQAPGTARWASSFDDLPLGPPRALRLPSRLTLTSVKPALGPATGSASSWPDSQGGCREPLVSAPFAAGLVLLHHARGVAPPRPARDALAVGPGPDIAAARPARGRAARPPGLASPGLAGVLDERRQLLPEGGGVLGGQIDLIRRPAEGEPDGL